MKRNLFSRRVALVGASPFHGAVFQGCAATGPVVTGIRSTTLSSSRFLQLKELISREYGVVRATKGSRGGAPSSTFKYAPARRNVMNSQSSSSASSQSPSHSSIPEKIELVLATDGRDPMRVALVEPASSRALRWLQNGFFIMLAGYLGYILFSGKMSKGLSIGPDTAPTLEERPSVTFNDVKGCDEVKGELEVLVKYLKDPASYGRLGAKIPAGILMVGPPGTGKTLLAKAVAGEAGVNFYYASGSSFDEVFVGVGEKRVRELFATAKKNAPSIIFLDEIDAVAGRERFRFRSTSTIHQLLAELDGFQGREGVIVIAATNYPDALDKALIRPGRFDKQIMVPLPDVKGRKEILDYYLSKVKAAPNIQTEMIARATIGFSGADLANLVNVAATKATLQGHDAVTTATIDEAKDDISLGPHMKSRVVHEQDIQVTAYHEAGHALVALYTPGGSPPYKISVLPRGMTGGTTQWLSEERNSYTLQQLKARLATAMGGRLAEELQFGAEQITTGAYGDFKQATDIAMEMVSKYGMSDRVGPMNISKDENTSSESKRLVEAEAKRLLDEAHAQARKVLTEHKKELKMLAEALLEYETLSKEEITMLLSGKELKEHFYKQYTRQKQDNTTQRIPLIKPALPSQKPDTFQP